MLRLRLFETVRLEVFKKRQRAARSHRLDICGRNIHMLRATFSLAAPILFFLSQGWNCADEEMVHFNHQHILAFMPIEVGNGEPSLIEAKQNNVITPLQLLTL
jgi:hypothetical protein